MKNKEYNKKINNFLTSLPALPYSPQGENKKTYNSPFGGGGANGAGGGNSTRKNELSCNLTFRLCR